MGFRNSPGYVQRLIDDILRPHRAFCRAYIDDIVIFSASLEEHVEHLNLVFEALDEKNLQISAKKSYLGYPTAKLLGQRVEALGLATADEKLEAIAHLHFPRSLAQLEKYLGLTGYLRQYIPQYAAITKPLQERKIYLNQTATKGASSNARKRIASTTKLAMPSPREQNVFHHLQKLFASPSILHHFDERRQLYIDLDASKEFGFGAHIYHSKADDKGQSNTPPLSPEDPKQLDKQPIMFLSRLLSDAETRYWPTELEIAGLVWVIKKVRHMIEAATKPPSCTRITPPQYRSCAKQA